MKHRIETDKVWNMETVRNFCIKYQYYTKGTGKEYDNLLNYVETHKPTNNALFKVAKDIYNHSDQSETSITYIMHELNISAIDTFFYVYETDENRNEYLIY